VNELGDRREQIDRFAATQVSGASIPTSLAEGLR
jgi:hypothetical protein